MGIYRFFIHFIFYCSINESGMIIHGCNPYIGGQMERIVRRFRIFLIRKMMFFGMGWKVSKCERSLIKRLVLCSVSRAQRAVLGGVASIGRIVGVVRSFLKK